MIELESMAVEMPEVKGHPNRVAFRGVLTVVDVPSQRAPFGSKGKRVLLTRQAAEKAIPSLLGMAVDYAPSFDRHDMQRKVGVITRADLVGRNLEVNGFLYAKDFPEIVEEIGKLGRAPSGGVQFPAKGIAAASSNHPLLPKPGRSGASTVRSTLKNRGSGNATEGTRLRASLAAAVREIQSMIGCARGRKKSDGGILRAETPRVAGSGTRNEAGLGMSFEVTRVRVANPRAKVWTLVDVTFTGAAILRKDKAAFEDTWIELA